MKKLIYFCIFFFLEEINKLINIMNDFNIPVVNNKYNNNQAYFGKIIGKGIFGIVYFGKIRNKRLCNKRNTFHKYY